jgi:hypothetical protein
MRACAISAIMLILLSIESASATVRIYDDRGGQIGNYLAKYQALRESGEQVVVDGACESACTILLGVIPRNRICVTSRASFSFHTAWNPTPEGNVVSSAGNQVLWSIYPSDVRKWIIRHGGLHSQIIYLRGPELAAMYPTCH